jgi:glycosyltransferase 2 family protein
MNLLGASVPTYTVLAAIALAIAVVAFVLWRLLPRHGAAVAAGADAPVATEIEEPPPGKLVRSPHDILTLAVGALVALIGLLLAVKGSNTLVGLEQDLANAFGILPWELPRIISLAVVLIAALLPTGVIVAALWFRKFRLLGMLVVGSIAGAIVLGALDAFVVNRFGSAGLQEAVVRPAWTAGITATVTSTWITSMTATILIAGPWLTHQWRRTAWILLALAVVVRIAAGTGAPLDVVLALGVGAATGAAVLFGFGAPNKRPDGRAVAASMARAGVPLKRLYRASVDARSSTPYFGEAADGRQYFIKVQGYDERSADLMFRVYRFFRVKDVGDKRPFSSLQRMVEHEALVSLYAADKGIQTPHLAATARVGAEGFLLAYERTEGESLDRVEDAEITDAVLHEIWLAVARLREYGVAHRDLRLANVMLAPDGQPCLIDFGFAEIAATDHMLDTDVAELLSSTALKVGVEQAVDAAIAVLGKDAIASAAPRIQPLALSTATRKGLQARKPLCDDLRKYAGQASGAGDVEPEDLERVKWKTVLIFISLAIAFYVLIPQLADVSGVWERLKQADWTWALYALVASALTYIGATIGLLGAVPTRAPFAGTLGTQLAGSFINRIVPARVGGIATNVRYLQKQGIDLAVATSSVGLQQLAGFLMHVALSALFLVWAGRSGAEAFHFLPSGQTVLIGATVILALSGLLFLLPVGRKLLRKRVWPVVKKSGRGMADVVHQPAKVIMLFAGPALLTMSYVAALVLSVYAFGNPHVSFASIAVVYLVGSAISSAAPTPGGIGAVEAALIAGLTAIGLDRDVAVPAVFLFRIVTFWLPILPGWLCFTLLERRGDL